MSFFDAIIDVARGVVGLPPVDQAEAAAPQEQPSAPERSADLAIDTPTTYGATSDRAGSTPQLQTPTLADRLQAATRTRPRTERASAATGRTTEVRAGGGGDATPPHERASAGATSAPPPAGTGSPTGTASTAAAATAATTAATTTPRPASSAGTTSTAAAPVTTNARATVWDATTATKLGTVDALPSSASAATAARNVQTGIDYYARTFGRDGLDGAGAGVDVLVDDRTKNPDGTEKYLGNGGYYATSHPDGRVTEAIHFGVGKRQDLGGGRLVSQSAMSDADDLTIHELTHGIIRKETGHLGGEADEAGATNEGIADVMAASATRDWSIGEGMYQADSTVKRMRNIADPGDPTALHGLWTTMDQIASKRAAGEEAEEHWASGVVSTAAYRVQQRIGGEAGWKAVEQVFYDAIDNGRLGDMSFAAVAAGLRTAAVAKYGSGSEVATVVDEELRRAGL